MRKFCEEARNRIINGQDISHLDIQAKMWYDIMHQVDYQNNTQVYATESTNVPPQISTWFQQFYKKYGMLYARLNYDFKIRQTHL